MGVSPAGEGGGSGGREGSGIAPDPSVADDPESSRNLTKTKEKSPPRPIKGPHLGTPKWRPTWAQHGPNMAPKWTENGPKMDPKSTKKWTKNGSKVEQNISRKVIRKKGELVEDTEKISKKYVERATKTRQKLA